MKIERIGYGAGQRDLAEQPNVLRLLVGEAADAADGSRAGLGAGDQPRRHQRRADRLLHRAAVGGRRAGRLHHGHPDEEEPAGREAVGPLPAGDVGGGRGDPASRDDHAGRAPLAGRPHVLRRRPMRSKRPGGRSRARWAGWPTACRGSPPSSSRAAGLPPSTVPLRTVYEAAQRAFRSRGCELAAPMAIVSMRSLYGDLQRADVAVWAC